MKKQMKGDLSHRQTQKNSHHLVVPDKDYFEMRPSSSGINIEMAEVKPPSQHASARGGASQLSVKSSLKVDLIHSAHILSREANNTVVLNESVPLFEHEILAFQFRDKDIPKGQYRLPFSFKLPLRLPGSFKYSLRKSNGDFERIMIEYTIEVYLDIPSRTKG